jgi:recombination protein RecA
MESAIVIKAKEKEDGLKKLTKDLGKCISKGSEILEEKQKLKTLQICPALDFALNGGVQEGSWVTVIGLPKTGKTSTVLQIAANAQKEGRKVIYLDGEGRIKSHNLVGIEGLDLEAMDIVHAPEDRILSAEEFLSILEILIQKPENEGAVVIIDSVSSLIPSRDLQTMVNGERRAGLPKIMGDFTRRMGQVIPRSKTIVIMISHLIANTSGFGKKNLPDGGIKIQYQTDTVIQVKKSEPWLESDRKIGQIIHWTIATSSLGASGTGATSYFRYNKGLDFVQEMIMLADDFDVINKSGAWYTCSFMEKHDKEWDEKKYKFQGQANLYKYLDANPKVMKILQQEMKEFLE